MQSPWLVKITLPVGYCWVTITWICRRYTLSHKAAFFGSASHLNILPVRHSEQSHSLHTHSHMHTRLPVGPNAHSRHLLLSVHVCTSCAHVLARGEAFNGIHIYTDKLCKVLMCCASLATTLYCTHPPNVVVYLSCKDYPSLPWLISASAALRQCRCLSIQPLRLQQGVKDICSSLLYHTIISRGVMKSESRR